MKTDVMVISSDGSGMDEALELSEKAAAYRGLSGKDVLHLRLLTEEMLGMMRSITGAAEGKFWIESRGKDFQLHLHVQTMMDYEKREQLLAASTSGENEAARGIMGKIRSFFDPLSEVPMFVSFAPGSMGGELTWSMCAYEEMLRQQLEKNDDGVREAWDELEKSVVSHVADEIKVSISGRDVEMTIFKQMKG